MHRIFIFLFSVASYGIFLLVFLYLLAFLANLPFTAVGDAWPMLATLVPLTIDYGRATGGFTQAVVIDVALIALFGLQHSVMARPGFKRAWTRVIPATAERSFYVLLSSAVLAFVIWQWRPVPDPVLWSAGTAVMAAIGWGTMIAGIAILLWSTFLIDHFDLFGLKQGWAALTQRVISAPLFKTPFLYKLVRHPLYVGWFLIFWGTPTMSAGHLLFAIGMSGYIFIAIQFEERDLVAVHGDDYERYRREVPMVVPRIGRRQSDELDMRSEG